MIIHEVDETNFIEEREKGKLAVQEKLNGWDRLQKQNISISEYTKKVSYLFRDPTIWSYGTLRDKQNKPLECHYFQDIINNDKHRFLHCTAANQIGKEQPYSAGVLTPLGWKKMGDISKGDSVIGEMGCSHKVIKIFEQGNKKVYKLTFDDGSSARCGLDHLWKYQSPNQRFRRKKDWSIGSLKDLISIDGMNPKPTKRVAIPVCKPVVFEEVRLPLDPYVLGVLLGDGGLTKQASLFTNDIEIAENILNKGYDIRKTKQKYAYSIYGILHIIKNLGLYGQKSNTKFVPREYLFNSIQNRLALLRGLMDTDGSIYGKGTVEYSTTSKKLKDAVVFLVQSCGGKANVKERKNDYLKNWRVYVKLQGFNPFSLKRKAKKHYDIKYRKERILRKIEYECIEKSRCILVDNPTNLYLTDNFIVTHNTWGAGIIKSAHHALHVNNASVMLISRSENQSKGILDEIKWMFKRSKVDYEPFLDEVSNRTELHLSSPDGVGTSVIRVFPPTPAILSFPATLIIQDETGFWEQKTITMPPIDYYNQCVEPRTNATKKWKHPFLTMGQIVSITNPNGQNGLAWWLYNNPRFHQYSYNWLANPDNDLEEYKEKESFINPIIFASTYAAKYILASGGFIDLDQYERFRSYNHHLAIPQGTLFLGGDLASEEPKSKNTDWNTLYGVIHIPNVRYPQNPRIQVVYRKEFPPRTKKEVYYSEIEKIKRLPGVYIGKFGYDKIGVGDSVKTDLIGRGILSEGQIEPLTYSLPNKSDVYLNFQALFQQDMLEGTHIPKLQEQLLALKVEQPTGSPHIKVHHKTEGVKDDEPDALANACYVARMCSYSSSKIITATRSDDPESEMEDVIEKGISSNEKFLKYIRDNSTGMRDY